MRPAQDAVTTVRPRFVILLHNGERRKMRTDPQGNVSFCDLAGLAPRDIVYDLVCQIGDARL